ncbi:MAG TPA: sulfite exporter TauE/SafE family protein, partial [Burkholderiales bacterium]|nr:sulfite exporter TauE/SafE family protein [Burkholderiales bacterium]
MIDPFFSLSGFAVGMLVGMTGVGGGALMTPILIMLFGIHPATAVGTDLLYAAATKTGGSLVHGFARSIDWRVVGRLATGSVPATVVTLGALSHFNLSGDAARNLITLVLSVALFATAFVLVFGGAIIATYRARVAELDPQRAATNTILIGALLGVLVSISSVGAGAIGVTALLL